MKSGNSSDTYPKATTVARLKIAIIMNKEFETREESAQSREAKDEFDDTINIHLGIYPPFITTSTKPFNLLCNRFCRPRTLARVELSVTFRGIG